MNGKVRVVAVAHIPNTRYVPRDIFDLNDAEAKVMLERKWVKLYRAPQPTRIEPDKIPDEVTLDDIETAAEDAPIETEMMEGAPEIAVSRRGRRRRRGRIIEPG